MRRCPSVNPATLNAEKMKEGSFQQVKSVSQINSEIRQLLDSEFRFVRVRGEVSSVRQPFSGHTYFILKDHHSQLASVLFKNQRRWTINHVSQPDRALGILKGMALDHEKLAADMNQPAVSEAIQQDVRDVKVFNIQATPEFFVNGKSLSSFGFNQLSQLVDKAVEEAY